MDDAGRFAREVARGLSAAALQAVGMPLLVTAATTTNPADYLHRWADVERNSMVSAYIREAARVARRVWMES